MLVLSRRSGERILIGDSIELTVIEIRGERVKLGFKAPHDVSIHREEVRRRDFPAAGQPSEPRSS